MSGFFGVVSKKDCVMPLFFGVDYHSHLGTKRGGMAVYGPNGFQRSIHNIENSPFRTKFERDVTEMEGNCGIGCISDNEAQPLLVSSHLGSFAITTVGRINNIDELKKECFDTGKVQFLEMSHGLLNPTELVAALINCKDNLIEGIRYAQERINGSMSILLLFPDKIYAARDYVGRTPVVIGKSKDSHCVSFESCAFLNLGYKSCYELGPGEIVVVESDSYTRLCDPNSKLQICSFLWTYYGYPTATYEGINVEAMRYRCGALLYKRDNCKVDSVAGVPDSGLAHAIGYANASGIPYTRPLIKYTPTWPRSFMPQNQKQRNLVARMKLIPVHDLIKGKKILLIDDSIVRGTQLSETVNFLYSSGVEEVHVRPACPPIMFGCKFLNFSRNVNNMDLISRKVIAELENVTEVTDEMVREYTDPDSEKYQQMVDRICEKMNFTSLKFHRLDDLIEAIGLEKCKLCTYCFNGKEESHTFSEYLLVPGYSSSECQPHNVSLKTPLVKFKKGEESAINLNIPLVSAIMQAVSNDTLAIALAKEGGISFIYGSQSIENQAAMVRKVKNYKAGFVKSDSNLKPTDTLADVIRLKELTGHSTVAITLDGTENTKLVGIVTGRDYRVSRMPLDLKIEEFMTPIEKLITAKVGITLKAANDIIWDYKLNSLPILDEEGRLDSFVFRKDYESKKTNPNELLDDQKRYMVGAGINTRDYMERIPALLEAGADVLCIDSSEGFSEWQQRTIKWVRDNYGESVKIGAGNVVDAEGFRFLAECGADFIKVGIGGGSICITRETKGIGRGQATAVIEVAQARDEYFKETGIYVPICSDGGIVHDYHMTLALAMGSDFIMLGRYFSRFDESPTNKVKINGQYMKEYWGEGSARARNWQRYDLGGENKLQFEEGVDSYVPYAGSLKDNVELSLAKVKHTMCNCGALTIPELQQKAKITRVSATSIVEGGAHDVLLKEKK